MFLVLGLPCSHVLYIHIFVYCVYRSPKRGERGDLGYGDVLERRDHTHAKDLKREQGDFYEVHKNQTQNKNHAVNALVKVVRKCLKEILMENR